MPFQWPWRVSRRALATTAAALLITAYGGLLRLEALSQMYGPITRPSWARALDQHVVPLARHVRPDRVGYPHYANPYVGGDPINYLRFARELQHFYQAHVREPIFLSWTRLWLWLLDDQDIGISFASASASTLAIFATYLLGSAVGSPMIGLLAALGLAVEFTAITWSPEGWRDDTFMLMVALTAWQLVRLDQHPTRGRAVSSGVVAAGACLTRLSALTLLVPALAWMSVVALRAKRVDTLKAVALSGVVAMALIAPYLVACARATGDPFYAVNYHTGYYRHGQGKAHDPSATAVSFLRDTFATRPIETIDTAAGGLFVWPMDSKFDGYGQWHTALGPTVRTLATVGLVAALWCGVGRLLLVVLFGSLAPYALTWSISDGGAWRFSEHVYPLYLVAAAWVLYALTALVRRPAIVRGVSRRTVWLAGATATMCAAGWLGYRGLPWLIAAERLGRGEAAMIVSGERDQPFFADGWSAPGRAGTLPARAATGNRATVDLPVEPGRQLLLTLRMDPPDQAGFVQSVAVFINYQLLGEVVLAMTPGRIGTYRFTIPASLASSSGNRLVLVPSRFTRAGDAGAEFGWLAPDTRVAFRLWYVRLEAVR
jgi:Dolichyl-phosphate-mannose-protein mannosyltransferase